MMPLYLTHDASSRSDLKMCLSISRHTLSTCMEENIKKDGKGVVEELL